MAADVSDVPDPEAETEVNERQSWLSFLEGSLVELRDVDAELEEQLEELETELAELETELAELETERVLTNRKVEQVRRRVARAERQVAALVDVQQKRMVSAYMGEGDLAAQAVAAVDDPTSVEVRRVLVDHVFTSGSVDLADLAELKRRLDNERADLRQQQRKLDRLVDEQAELVEQATSKRDAVAEARNELSDRIEMFVGAMAEMGRSEQVLSRYAASGSQVGDGSRRRINLGLGRLEWPTDGPMTSPYGMRWGVLHQGIDIGAPTGTPIRVVADGEVIFAGANGGYGLMTIVDHGDGVHTAYAHQSALVARGGQRVRAGDVIGKVGSTGHSTGPHLHFEIRVGGTAIDPLPHLSGRR